MKKVVLCLIGFALCGSAFAQSPFSNSILILEGKQPDIEQGIKDIEASGGQPVHVFPGIIIGRLPVGSDAEILAKGIVSRIYHTRVEPSSFPSMDTITRYAINTWNHLIDAKSWLKTDREGLSWGDERFGKEGALHSIPSLAPGVVFSERLTSEYMYGRVRVGILLAEGPRNQWTSGQIQNVMDQVVLGLDWWAGRAFEYNAYVYWMYEWRGRVSTSVEPIEQTSGIEHTGGETVVNWIDQAMSQIGYRTGGVSGIFEFARDMRIAWQTDWAFTIFVANGNTFSDGYSAWANIWNDGPFGYFGRYHGGPYLVMTYENGGWGIGNMHRVVAHETGHIFGAADEYYRSGGQCANSNDCYDRYGYLNVNNGNCELCGGSVDCIMKTNNLTLCWYTLGHIGWTPSNDRLPSAVDKNTQRTGWLWDVSPGQRVKIYNVLDQFVKFIAVTPWNIDLTIANRWVLVWDGTNFYGETIAKGLYYVNIEGSQRTVVVDEDLGSPQFLNIRRSSLTTLSYFLRDIGSPGDQVIVKILDSGNREVSRPISGQFQADEKDYTQYFGSLPPGDYTAYLTAWDGGGNSITYPFQFNIPNVPSRPTLYSDWMIGEGCKTGSYRPGIHWTQPPNATKYKVKRHWWTINPPRELEEVWESYPAAHREAICFGFGNFPIRYWVQAGNDAGWSDWSNEIDFLYPPGGDPLVSYTHDSLATGYPNGQKVVLDRKDRLHVVFTSGDTVYYTKSNKKAKKWSSPVAIGLGKFPAIAIDSQDDPHVLWVSGTQVLSSQLASGVWTSPFSLYSQPLAQTIEAPSFVINTANDSGFASWTLVTAESSAVSLASFVPGDTTSPVSVQNVDVGAGTPFASPSLALDPSGNVLISWSREGEVYFQERGGSIINLSQSSDLSIHPVVDAYGDRVSVTYQEQDSSGAFKVRRIVKEDGVWGASQLINLFSGNALFPATAGASQVAFSSDVAGRREIYYHGDYEDGGVIYGTTLSASSEGNAHNFPSIALDNDWPKATLHCVWTGEMPLGIDVIWPVKTLSIEVPPVPLVFVDPGKATPSSHTVQRAGPVTYGSQPYLTADQHPQKLIYRFTGLNPSKRYRLGVTYYFEKPGETWRMRLKVDGRDEMRTRIPSGERLDDSNWVPASVYQDGVIDVEITPDAGDFALCNEIALYEFNRGSGGPQTDEAGPIVELPLTYALGQSFPNPFQDNATIAYQLPEEVPVSLKVYNVTGQVVREVVSGKQKPGYYQAVWDGKDGTGHQVSSGIYFYRLNAGGFSKTNKLVVVR